MRFLPFMICLSGCLYSEAVLTPISDNTADTGDIGWFDTSFGEDPYHLLSSPLSAWFALDGEGMEITDFSCTTYYGDVEGISTAKVVTGENHGLLLPAPIGPVMLALDIPEGADVLCRLTLSGNVVREAHIAP